MTTIQKRDSGIDLLRLFAMGLIILHHLITHGGLSFTFSHFTISGMAMHLLNAVTRCAVNAYALISGYVMVQSRFRPSRLISLWLQVVFFAVLGVLCLPLMGERILPEHLFSAVTPVSHDYYWYFTCYTVVFCLSPFLNLLLNSMNKRQAGWMLAALAILFSILPTFMLVDRFQLNKGYHAGWLVILYLYGGAFRMHGFHKIISRKKAVLICAGCILASWTFRLAALAMNAAWLEEHLLNYTSPTMLLCGAALIALFSGCHLPERIARAVSVLSPLTFGVYLIHDNPLVREHLIRMRVIGLAGLSPVGLLAGLFACWAGVYALCLLIEWLRTKLFALLCVPALCSRLETLLLRRAQRCFPDK